jgi:phosphonopyruvate decarboxylase
MIEAGALLAGLRACGRSFVSGVPCSFLTPLINAVINDRGLDYVGAASEGEAVGINLGASLAGRSTVILCQNSGLGNTVNPLTSLNFPFRIPTLLITTWRGEPGVADEPQHELMGRITHRLLETMEIPWLPFPEEPGEIGVALDQAEASMRTRQLPFAFVMRKDTIAPCALEPRAKKLPVTPRERLLPFDSPEARLTRTGAIEHVLGRCEDSDAVIATTGKTGRELFTVSDRPGNFYVVGGMGTASAIGLGVSQILPRQRVFVLDGDGAALMKLGTLATIGHSQPERLIHIVLDNEVHDSTGGQATVSPTVQFARVAAAAGYRNVFSAERPADLDACLATMRSECGPSLLHLKIRQGSPAKLGRPTVKPPEVRERFMQFLAANRAAAGHE